MDKQKQHSLYGYGKTEYTISFLPFLIMGISAPLLLINIVILLTTINTQKLTIEYFGNLFGMIVSLVFILVICPAAINQHNKIYVTPKGIKVRVFSILKYRWLEVTWQEILGVELAKRPDRWMKTLWIISVEKLTLWHRFLSFIFHTGNHPIILISSDMENREFLLDIVRNNIKDKL